MSDERVFTYNGGAVPPGETQNIRYGISETYLGDPVRIPVTIVNGERDGPTAFLTAAAHGDELNGIEVVREVAHEWDLSKLAGTLVCLPVLNVPGFLAQQRYLPVYDRDLNRSFPGKAGSTSSKRMANQIYSNFIAPCDFGLDFHTSTRGRTNMLHVRGDMTDDGVHRLALAFGSKVVIDSDGPSGTPRRGDRRRDSHDHDRDGRGAPVPAPAYRRRARGGTLRLRRVQPLRYRYGALARLADDRRRYGREDVAPGRLRRDRRHPLRERLTRSRGPADRDDHQPVQERRGRGRSTLHRPADRPPREPGRLPRNPLCHLVEIESTRRAIEAGDAPEPVGQPNAAE